MAGDKKRRKQAKAAASATDRNQERGQDQSESLSITPALPKIPIRKAPDTRKCAFCPESSVFHCQSCEDSCGLLSKDLTYYCSADCQTRHQEAHDPICKGIQARKQLYNAGHLLQHVAYIFRGAAFPFRIRGIEVVGEEQKALHIFGKRAAGISLDDFPEWICPTPAIRLALLTQLYDTEVISFLTDLIGEAVTGIAPAASEIRVEINPTAIPLCSVLYLHKTAYQHVQILRPTSHEIVTVLLHSNTKYALDLTSAQYGWHPQNPVTPWESYAESKVLRVVENHGFGLRRAVTALRINSSSTVAAAAVRKALGPMHASVPDPRQDISLSEPMTDYYLTAILDSLAKKLVSLVRDNIPDELLAASSATGGSGEADRPSKLRSLLVLPREEFKRYETALLDVVNLEFWAVVAEREQMEFDEAI